MGVRSLLLVWLVLWAGGGASPTCDRSMGQVAPKSKADGRFSLQIISPSGQPNVYTPSETYTIKVEGMREGKLSAKFAGFSLVVETAGGTGPGPRPALSAGSFVLFGDALTTFSEECPAMVRHTSLAPKPEVQVMWTAPPPGHGCVTFKATVVEKADMWYQDEPPLSRTLCETSQANEEEGRVNRQCCACDEAKYEMTFEGLWSRHTHPKDFPTNVTATRFSDVIGASHTTDYRFWEYGGSASEGLKMVAEKGMTRTLETELKGKSQHIRTIIKARGISYPNVTGKTFAVFRVDSRHHLISVVSKIDPSPDWIVGVSAYELCLSNCTWLESRVINLFPWDAGTDSGITYTSPDMPNDNRDNIRRITTHFPSDPRSPFYDPSGEEMKPLARLYLTRQRLYEKTCANLNEEYQRNEGAVCEVGEWSEWGACQVTCGQGKRMRQRSYRNPERAARHGCRLELTARDNCYSPVKCPDSRQSAMGDMFGGGESYGMARSEEPVAGCTLTDWSPWSPCSVSCGTGEQHRIRHTQGQKWKDCMSLTDLMREDKTCTGPPCVSSPQMEELREWCEVGNWSPWSPCSASCGPGSRTRVRQLRTELGQDPSACSHLNLHETLACQVKPDCQLTPREARDDTTEIQYGGIDSKSQHRHGLFVAVTGVDGVVIDCRVSSWSEWTDCSVTCGRGHKTRTRQIMVHAKNGGKVCPKKLLKRRRCNPGPCPGPGMRRYEGGSDYEDDESSTGRDDCSYSEWGPWSRCSASCGDSGVQQRTRSVQLALSPDPTSCTDRLQTRSCTLPPCRKYTF